MGPPFLRRESTIDAADDDIEARGRGLLGLTLIASPLVGASQPQTSVEGRLFRIEWQVEQPGERPTIVGTVRNGYSDPIKRVQVLVQVLDTTGQVIHDELGTAGDARPGGRGDFRLSLPVTGARYVITVHSFEFGAVQSP